MTHALSTLLQQDNERTDAARALGKQLDALTQSMEDYREAWKLARQLGWAKTDLMRAGFINPQRFPRAARTRTTTEHGQSENN